MRVLRLHYLYRLLSCAPLALLGLIAEQWEFSHGWGLLIQQDVVALFEFFRSDLNCRKRPPECISATTASEFVSSTSHGEWSGLVKSYALSLKFVRQRDFELAAAREALQAAAGTCFESVGPAAMPAVVANVAAPDQQLRYACPEQTCHYSTTEFQGLMGHLATKHARIHNAAALLPTTTTTCPSCLVHFSCRHKALMHLKARGNRSCLKLSLSA